MNFLTARWQYLAMLNYVVDPALLGGRVPTGAELDFFGDRTYVSVDGTVLYDGACEFCTAWLRYWRPLLHRRGYGVDTLQAPWLAQRLGMNARELLSDIRLTRPDGALISGADVYLDVMRRVWWTYPLYAVCRLPGFNTIFRNAYRAFARNRYCISGRCSIESSHRS